MTHSMQTGYSGYLIEEKPYYLETDNETSMFAAAYDAKFSLMLKDFKQSTRQRFVSLTFDYPDPEKETEIVSHEGGVARGFASKLVSLASKSRNIKEYGLAEPAPAC